MQRSKRAQATPAVPFFLYFDLLNNTLEHREKVYSYVQISCTNSVLPFSIFDDFYGVFNLWRCTYMLEPSILLLGFKYYEELQQKNSSKFNNVSTVVQQD